MSRPWPPWRRGQPQESCKDGHYCTRVKLTGSRTANNATRTKVYTGHCLDCGHNVALVDTGADP